MQKSALITITFLLIISQVTHVLATTSENASREIERVEIGENYKKIIYKDGTVEMFVNAIANLKLSDSVTADVIKIPKPPFPFPIEKIFELIKQILEALAGGGVGCALLAWKIWNIIKGLRRGRPRDYRGAAWQKF